ncbi:MAG: VOC family protein [Myxococcales bacterium]|nr:VOC family protein [Myxococcales bacterium]
MTHESAVDFPTPTRVHVALAVRDVARATRFYRALLGQAPTKERPGYAKFEVLDPPLNLALNETPQASAPPLPQHFGIQVKQRATIGSIATRLHEAGFSSEVEEQVTCCYAVQDKRWATDPDGHRWELFIVTDADAPVHSVGEVGPGRSSPSADAPSPDEPKAPCCAPSCCS